MAIAIDAGDINGPINSGTMELMAGFSISMYSRGGDQKQPGMSCTCTCQGGAAPTIPLQLDSSSSHDSHLICAFSHQSRAISLVSRIPNASEELKQGRALLLLTKTSHRTIVRSEVAPTTHR